MASAQTGAAQAAGSAQPALGSPAFEELIRGKKVVVTTSDGSEREGVFTVSPAGLVGAAPGPAIVMPYDRIVRVEKVSHHLRKWTLLGLAAGAGVGVVLAVNDGENLAFMLPPVVGGIGSGVGALIGGVINAEHRKTDVVYDARRRTRTMSLVPIVSPTRKGIAFRMTWR
jgi:hypothetical protein